MDTDLVVRAQHGDEQAFASLAVAAGDRLHAVAHRILRDIDLAEDATQQALLSVWRDLPQLRDPARFDAWSYRLLVRACYAEASRTRRWSPKLRRLELDEVTAPDGLNRIVDRDLLERAFRRLPIEQRSIVVLRFYVGLPVDEVAEMLGIPVGTVSSRLHYAIRAMRAAIDADARVPIQEAIR
jgi:RNA polymerase sigma-70 factor (ECF subfamily)